MAAQEEFEELKTVLSFSGISAIAFILWLLKRISYCPKLSLSPANAIGHSPDAERLVCYCDSAGRGFTYMGVCNGNKKEISIDELEIHFASPLSLAAIPDDDHFDTKASNEVGYGNCIFLKKPVFVPSMRQWSFAFGVSIPPQIKERDILISITTSAKLKSFDSILTRSKSKITKFTVRVLPSAVLPELVCEKPFKEMITQEIMRKAPAIPTRPGVAIYTIRDPDGHLRDTMDPTK